jgi:hypothetical protein
MTMASSLELYQFLNLNCTLDHPGTFIFRNTLFHTRVKTSILITYFLKALYKQLKGYYNNELLYSYTVQTHDAVIQFK